MHPNQGNAAARPIRVLIAKVGLDGHDRGAKVIVHALRDAGMEVIYTGLRKSPEAVVKTAIEEDVDAIGLSILSGAHNSLVPRVLELLRDSDAAEIPVLLGGTIPAGDVDGLKAVGVAAIFGPGTPLTTVIESVRACVEKVRAESPSRR